MSVDSLRSSLLLAMPQLQDPNFRRAVVLIIEHGSDGTFGLVLNREVELAAGELCESLGLEWGGDPAQDLHWGGPVQANTGWVLFGDDVMLELDGEDVTRVGPGVSFAGSLRVLEMIAGAPPEDVRLFLGYAGWGPGQLEEEMAQGAWLIAPASAEIVFGETPDAMWDRVVRGLGVDPATLVATSGVH